MPREVEKYFQGHRRLIGAIGRLRAYHANDPTLDELLGDVVRISEQNAELIVRIALEKHLSHKAFGEDDQPNIE